MDAPTLRLHLPLLVSGYGVLNSLSLELCNISYLDNKLSYYIRVAVWQQIFLKIRCNVFVFNQSMLFLYKVKKPQFLLVKPRLFSAGPTRLELATSGLTGRRSNQLNYDPFIIFSYNCYRLLRPRELKLYNQEREEQVLDLNFENYKPHLETL